MSNQDAVYVISAFRGDYSDREEWVCGVFTDRAKARALVEQKDREAREAMAKADEWRRAYSALKTPRLETLERNMDAAKKIGAVPPAHIVAELKELRDKRAAFIEKYGDKPKYPDAYGYYLVAVSPNTWGAWNNHEIEE